MHAIVFTSDICLTRYCYSTAFTELQTDLELVYHPSEGTLPFLDFRSFAMRFLFPREENHAILHPLEVCTYTKCTNAS